MAKYLPPIKRLGGAALIVFIFGLIWPSLSNVLFSQVTRSSVLILAIPFVAFFVCILLLFILLIFLVALRFNGKIPRRTYRGVELMLIGGIVVGVACLFQPWTLVPYRYGFILLLASTLGFILWSHVAPRKQDETETGVTRRQQIIGAAIALLIVLVLTVSAASANAPHEPYGLRQRIWDTYSQEKKETIAADAISSFQNVEIPFLVVFNLFPAIIAYFISSEVAGRANGRKKEEKSAVTALPNTTRA